MFYFAGDVLVYVNDTIVLGFSHQDVVNMFQGITIGEKVTLEVCRGYPLPFDPNDPNTEIITTVAVTLPEANSTPTTNTSSYSTGYNNLSRSEGDGLNVTARSIKSMPDLSRTGSHERQHVSQRNKSFDELNNESTDNFSILPNGNKPEIIAVKIVKGTMGFGFTIADSVYGQKVKQILDKQRCQYLLEGDVLLEINQYKVKDMSHNDVVKVLKECPTGTASDIIIQRGGECHLVVILLIKTYIS